MPASRTARCIWPTAAFALPDGGHDHAFLCVAASNRLGTLASGLSDTSGMAGMPGGTRKPSVADGNSQLHRGIPHTPARTHTHDHTLDDLCARPDIPSRLSRHERPQTACTGRLRTCRHIQIPGSSPCRAGGQHHAGIMRASSCRATPPARPDAGVPCRR